jgi:hypothetical protein
MPAERAPLCHGLAVVTGLVTYLGLMVIAGLVIGDLAGTLQREAIDVAPYWLFSLPLCYLAAGVLGYLCPVRTWRWSLDMIGTHAVCMVLLTGGGPNLWPLALALALVLALPGILTGWLGGFVYRFRSALHQASG